KCVIKDMSSAGLICFTSTVNAVNTLIHTCGYYTLYCDFGGTYNFTNCTFDNSNDNSSNRVPSILMSNRDYKNRDSMPFHKSLFAAFRNCILWGNIDDEVQQVKTGTGGSTFQLIAYKNII